MALLPVGFMPLPVASLYLIGCLLEEVSNRDEDDEFVPGLGFAIRPFARRRPSKPMAPNGLPRRIRVQSLVATAVHPVPGGETHPRDLYETAISIRFEDENRRPFYWSKGRSPVEGGDDDDIGVTSSAVDHLTLTLRIPVLGCLSKPRIRENVNSTGLIASFAPLPDDLEINISPLEEAAVARYRQALAAGYLRAHLAQEDGRTAPIPADFWRTDAALRVLTEKLATGVEVEGRHVRGHVVADLLELRKDWRQAFMHLPSSGLLAGAQFWGGDAPAPPLTTPHIRFLEQVADALGYVNGQPTRWDLKLEQISEYIERKWSADQVKKLGPYVTGMGTSMARLIANPGVIKGGTPKGHVQRQRAEWEKIFADEFGIKNRALA